MLSANCTKRPCSPPVPTSAAHRIRIWIKLKPSYLDNGGEFLVGTLQDRVVAMGALRRTDPDRAEIKRMRVHADFQRHGFGQAIYAALEKRARELGYSVLHLDTAVVLVGAQHFYTKNGFKEVRRGKLADFDCIFYEKQLSSGGKP